MISGRFYFEFRSGGVTLVSMNKNILIVDDDRTERRMIAGILRRSLEFGIREAENGREAVRILDKDADGAIALVILDLDMPIMGGTETLAALAEKHAHVPVIILTGETDTGMAVEAMKLGAADFLSKPVESARLDVSARNALKMSLMSREISRLRRHEEGGVRFADLIGHDAGLQAAVKTGRKAAACELPVLLTGETGTGKEVFARAIHGESARAGQPFIALNCGAIPEKLVESTLFGHEKGAFTGAVDKAPGKFLEADGGTIFLDEIGELPLEAQVKLLRVLQDGVIEPVGAARPVPVNVRVLSATNRDLAGEIRAGRFREDLYFRLNVLHLELLPLRQRKIDIPALAAHFIDQFGAAHGGLPKRLGPQALEKLQAHGWPGNVRELENAVNRAMALGEDAALEAADFAFLQSKEMGGHPKSSNPQGLISPLRPDGSFKSLHEFEQDIVALALAHHAGNISQTARVLGIAKSTLYTKIEGLADLKSA